MEEHANADNANAWKALSESAVNSKTVRTEDVQTRKNSFVTELEMQPAQVMSVTDFWIQETKFRKKFKVTMFLKHNEVFLFQEKENANCPTT